MKTNRYISSFHHRFGPLLFFTLIISVFVALAFGNSDAKIHVSVDISFFLAFPLFVVGSFVQAATSPRLLGIGPTGIKLNWLDEEINWSDVSGGRVIIAQGFTFGMTWVQLELRRELCVPIESNSELLVADGFIEWLEMQWRVAKNAAPVWEMVTPTTLQIVVPRINSSAEDLAKDIEQYLDRPLSRN
jgi:hypothetical protein